MAARLARRLGMDAGVVAALEAAYARWDGDPQNATVVLVNFANQAHQCYTIGLPSGGSWKVRFNSDSPLYAPEFGGVDAFDV